MLPSVNVSQRRMEGRHSEPKKKNASDVFTIHDYVDVLEKQKKQYDTFFALKAWKPKPVLHPETTRSLAEKIVNSPRMKDTIHQVY